MKRINVKLTKRTIKQQLFVPFWEIENLRDTMKAHTCVNETVNRDTKYQIAICISQENIVVIV